MVSSTVDIEGTADGAEFTGYVLEYGAGSVPMEWVEMYSSASPVTGGTLGTWNTAGMSGQYTVRLRAGEYNSHMVTVHLANTTSPVISAPADHDTVSNWVAVLGTAVCPAFRCFAVEYASHNDPAQWHQVGVMSIPVFEDQLAEWATSGLAEGWYRLRLSLYSDAGWVGSDSTDVYVVSPYRTVCFSDSAGIVSNYGDFDNDGEYEIVVGTAGGIAILNPDLTPDTTWSPAIPEHDFRVPITVGNLDNDGIDDLVAAEKRNDPSGASVLLGLPSLGSQFRVTLPAKPFANFSDSHSEYSCARVFVGDIDSDGRDEIFYFAGNGPYYVYSAEGDYLGSLGTASSAFLSADLDNDGVDEFYGGYHKLYRYESVGGPAQDSFDLQLDHPELFKARNVSAVDIDSDDTLELFVFGNYDETDPTSTHWLFAFDRDLTPLAGWPHNTEITAFLARSPPVFGDFDRDGRHEYLVTTYDEKWGWVHAWRADGTPFAGEGLPSGIFARTSNPAILHWPILADVNGTDTSFDVIAYAHGDLFASHTYERLLAWDRWSQVLTGWPLRTVRDTTYAAPWRYTPTVGDFDQDGSVDLLCTTDGTCLMLLSFPGVTFDTLLAPAPFWRYNRRMDNIGPPIRYVCGDIDNDYQQPSVADLTYLVAYLFYQGPPAAVMTAANVDGITGPGGSVDVADLVYLVAYLFQGGPEPICE